MTKNILTLILIVSFQSVCWACICSNQPYGIDSKSDIENYDFVGLVEVKNEYLAEEFIDGSLNVLEIDVIQSFKGGFPEKVIEYGTFSTCDMGISEGEQWLFFGFKDSTGIFSIGPCERNVRYKDNEGQRYRINGISSGFFYLNRLQGLFQKNTNNQKPKDYVCYYENGNKEVEEHFKNGELDGSRKIWYSNGQLMILENYKFGQRNGKRKSFYRSGQLASESYFNEGEPFLISRTYYDTVYTDWERNWLINKYSETNENLEELLVKIRIRNENIYDWAGNQLISRVFWRNGKIKKENIYQSEFRQNIEYYLNGGIKTISYFSGTSPIGKHFQFFENGRIDEANSWEYDKNGNRKK